MHGHMNVKKKLPGYNIFLTFDGEYGVMYCRGSRNIHVPLLLENACNPYANAYLPSQ